MSSSGSYDLVLPPAVRLAGFPLRALVWVADLPILRGLIAGKLFQDNGVMKQRADADLQNYEIAHNPHHHGPVLQSPAFAQPADSDGSGASNDGLHNLQPALNLIHAVQVQPRDDAFRFWSIQDYHDAYKSGRTNPIDVTRRIIFSLKASQRATPPMNIMASFNETLMLQSASASAARWQNNAPLSILDGVPVAVKDEMHVEGYPTGQGTTFMAEVYGEQEDATVVARLRAQGVIIIGKTNMMEFGLGVTGNNPHTGVPRNPYHPQHYPGASSSGSAVAVAAGLCPIALGADAGGSIRIPAGFCGVFGLKPTFGRVSGAGVCKMVPNLGHTGMLAATATDMAVAYMAMAGGDERDVRSLRQPAAALYSTVPADTPLKDLKIGIYDEWFRDADARVVSLCNAFLTKLTEEKGATKRAVTLPNLDSVRIANMVQIIVEAGHHIAGIVSQHKSHVTPDTSIAMLLASHGTPQDYFCACQARSRFMTALDRVFADVDVLITPASAITAPVIREDAETAPELDIQTIYHCGRFAPQFNLSGHPAVVVPVGYAEDGLPVSVQVVGRHWEEGTLLKIARAAEELVERKKPRVYYDVLGE